MFVASAVSVVRFQTFSRWMYHSVSDNGNPAKQTDTHANSAACVYSFEEGWLICLPPALTVADSTYCPRCVFVCLLGMFITIKTDHVTGQH